MPYRVSTSAIVGVVLVLMCASVARAQEAAPPLPWVVVDVHGAIPRFPQTQGLADSRNVNIVDMPGTGIGGQVGVHVYPLHWRAITFGLGGEVIASRASTSATTVSPGAHEKFLSASPQLSFNFGSGNGWSYISGGIGVAQWSIVPQDGSEPLDVDSERLRAVSYGFGARWFAKQHVAFSFDVRFYEIAAGTPSGNFPASPRSHFMIFGVGASFK